MCQKGWTPLMKAAWDGQLPVLEYYLVKRGANSNAQDNVNEQLAIKLLFVTFA